jgi:carboxylate-amine ligase
MHEYLEILEDVVEELGSGDEIAYIRTMLEQGTGADRQLKVFHETGDLKEVVKYIIEETESGVVQPEAQTSHA